MGEPLDQFSILPYKRISPSVHLKVILKNTASKLLIHTELLELARFKYSKTYRLYSSKESPDKFALAQSATSFGHRITPIPIKGKRPVWNQLVFSKKAIMPRIECRRVTYLEYDIIDNVVVFWFPKEKPL